MIEASLRSGKINRFFRSWMGKLLIVIAAAAIVLGLLISFKVINIRSTANADVEQRTAEVRRNNITLTLSGSGSATSANRADITPYVAGTITKVYFKEGDAVKEGDLLFEVDDSDVRLDLQKIENSIAQNQLSFKETLDNIEKLKVTAPFTGKVTGVTVKKGDTVNKNGVILTLTDKSKMLLSLSFNSGIEEIEPGKSVTVNIQSYAQSIEGKITKVNGVSSQNHEVNVEIELQNPGLLDEGMKASGSINTSQGEVWSTENGTLTYIDTQTIKSVTGGDVKAIYVSENQYVESGKLLLELEDDSLEISVQNNDIKIQELKSELEYAKEQVENCRVISPIEGVIVSQSVNEGDVVKAGQILCTVANNNTMEMSISIDELDIAKVETGMQARVTVDALTETSKNPLAAIVSNIAIEGSSSGGVTTYPVTVTVENPGNMKGGMNANAEIILSSKENILVVPIEAVQNMGGRSMVMVKGGTSAVAAQVVNAGGNEMRGRNRNSEIADENKVPQRNLEGEDSIENKVSERKSENEGYSDKQNRQIDGNSDGSSEKQIKSNVVENSNVNEGENAKANTNANTNGRAASGWSGAKNGMSDYYKDAVPVMVEVGINNETYIEILSGLNEGDQVILPQIVANKQTQSTQNMMGGGMMGGGMPSVRVNRGGNTGGGNR